MESVHKITGKIFTGKFAETAVKIGIATPKGEDTESIPEAKKDPESKPEVKTQPKAKTQPARRGKKAKK